MFAGLRLARLRRVSSMCAALAVLVAAAPSVPCLLLCAGAGEMAHDGPMHGMPGRHLPPCHGVHLTSQLAQVAQTLSSAVMLPGLRAPLPTVVSARRTALPSLPFRPVLQPALPDPPPPRLS